MHIGLGDTLNQTHTVVGFDWNWVSVMSISENAPGALSRSYIERNPTVVEPHSTCSLREVIAERFVLAGTGSRNYHPELHPQTHSRLEYVLLKTREKHPDLVVMSGGAEGWDYWLAQRAFELEIPVVLCIPNSGYGTYYFNPSRHSSGEQAPQEWADMLRAAQAIELTSEVHHLDPHSLNLNGLHMNFVRNNRMVELASGFVVFDAGSRGTKHCVEAIQRTDKKYMVL